MTYKISVTDHISVQETELLSSRGIFWNSYFFKVKESYIGGVQGLSHSSSVVRQKDKS